MVESFQLVLELLENLEHLLADDITRLHAVLDHLDLVEREFIINTLKEHSMLSDSVAHCILKIANNLNVSELQLSQLCFSMADATIQEERNK